MKCSTIASNYRRFTPVCCSRDPSLPTTVTVSTRFPFDPSMAPTTLTAGTATDLLDRCRFCVPLLSSAQLEYTFESPPYRLHVEIFREIFHDVPR